MKNRGYVVVSPEKRRMSGFMNEKVRFAKTFNSIKDARKYREKQGKSFVIYKRMVKENA